MGKRGTDRTPTTTVLSQEPDGAKKSRIDDAPAVVTDEFTAESVRQVPTAEDAQSTDHESTSIQQSATTLKLSHSVRHQVAIPPGYDYVPLSKHVPRDPLAHGLLSWIHSNERQCTALSVTRASSYQLTPLQVRRLWQNMRLPKLYVIASVSCTHRPSRPCPTKSTVNLRLSLVT